MKKIKELKSLGIALKAAQNSYDYQRSGIVQLFEQHAKVVQATLDKEYDAGAYLAKCKFTSNDSFVVRISFAVKEVRVEDEFVLEVCSDGNTNISVENKNRDSMGKMALSMSLLNKITEDIINCFNQ